MGANVNAEGGNALYAASEGAITEVCRFSSSRRRMSTLKRRDDTALQQHQKGGHREVGRLLLERGADVDAERRVWQCATSSITGWPRGGGEILLEHGAISTLKEDEYGNALQAAVYGTTGGGANAPRAWSGFQCSRKI